MTTTCSKRRVGRVNDDCVNVGDAAGGPAAIAARELVSGCVTISAVALHPARSAKQTRTYSPERKARVADGFLVEQTVPDGQTASNGKTTSGGETAPDPFSPGVL